MTLSDRRLADRTLSDHSKRVALAATTPRAERPKIWIEGRQGPRFDLRAYGATSFAMAKRDLVPAMVEAEARLWALGQRLTRDNPRAFPVWASGLQRAVPSRQRVSGWANGLARLFSDSRARVVPAGIADLELAYPDLIRGSRKPAPTRPPAAALKPAGEPTLHAIRSAISQTAHDAGLDAPGHGCATAQAPRAVSGKANPGAGLVAKVKQVLWGAACRTLLGILLAFAIPGGAIKALVFHLNGGDLSDWPGLRAAPDQ